MRGAALSLLMRVLAVGHAAMDSAGRRPVHHRHCGRVTWRSGECQNKQEQQCKILQRCFHRRSKQQFQ